MAHTQFRWKVGVKWLLNIDFFNMSGSSLHSGRMFLLYVLFPVFKKMETLPTHIKKSMFSGHFTPIFHQN
jgi:hypothetical protein